VLCLARTRQEAGWIDWILYSVSVTAALYVSPLAVVVVAALNLWYFVAYVDAKRAIPWLASNALAIAAYVPYARILVHEKPWKGLEAADEAALTVLARLVNYAAGGFDVAPWIAQVLAVALLLLILAGVTFTKPRQWRVSLAPLMVGGIPLAVALWMISMRVPVNASTLLPLALPLIVCAGAGCAVMRTGWMRRSALALVVAGYGAIFFQAQVMALWSQRAVDAEPRYDYRSVARYITDHFANGDLIAHADASSIAPLLNYSAESESLSNALVTCAWTPLRDPALDRLNGLGPTYLGPRRPVEIESTARPHPRVWLIFSAADRKRLDDRPRSVKAWLDSHLFERDHREFPGVEVFLYERKINGHWTRLEGRDADNGVSANLTYWFGETGAYTQVREDAGPLATSPDERRGRLRLQFDAAPIGDRVVPLVHGAATREQGFSITNDAREPVKARLRVAATVRLVDMTGMIARESSSSVWRMSAMSNGTRFPESWPLPTMTAEVRKNGSASGELDGGIHLDAGDYFMYLYQWVTINPTNKDRAMLSITVGDKLTYRAVSNFPDETGGWTWTYAGFHGQKLKDDLAHITAAASLPGMLTKAATECAYLAFVPRLSELPSEQAKSSFWEGDVTVESGETLHWRAVVNDCMERIDVWAQELDETGQAYRIFRKLN
ncbi:MAG: hypothetical protein HZB26_24460, partial [Candidatus Hydrogenedentes bacterium]|nr:hypothetical protein [Candidatus Hydrogenedentota bacterium]